MSNQEAKAWWNFYNIEVTKDDAIFVRHDLFAGPEESSQDQLFVTPSYLKAQHIKTKEDFSNLKLGEYALLIPKNQMKNRQKLITKYNKSLTETTQNGKKETKMKAKYVEEVPNGEKRFIYNVAYEKMTTQQEISDPIIVVITPQSSGEETGISWAGDNDYFFVKGKEQTLNRLKELGLYDKVHYLVNAYGQYEAQTNLVKESLSMAIISAIITIIVISFFYILLHVLYFTHFRRTIVIKFISGMPNLRIHLRFIFVELGLLVILLPTLTIISNEFLYSLFVVSALWFISLIILLVQMKNFENGQINSLKGEWMFELTNITKEFLHRKVFDNFKLTFEAGKVYAIIGQSGSGKTTLLNMIAKLESYEGSILYEGKELSKIKKHSYFLNDLSYLFQNFGLIENETIDKNLDLGLINQKLSKKTKQEKKLETLAQVNVAYLKLNQKIYELSGGEAQRVALAKAILKDSPVILADEPTAALDSENSEEVMKLLLSMKNENRIIIIATHNPVIWEMADEVVELSR